MIDLDQLERAALTNLDLFIAVKAMELKFDLQRDFADLRQRDEARWDALALQYKVEDESAID